MMKIIDMKYKFKDNYNDNLIFIGFNNLLDVI